MVDDRKMGHFSSLAAVFALCMFSLFFTLPDIRYVCAFLCALIVCGIGLSLDSSAAVAGASLLFFTASFFLEPFLYFYPAVACILMIHRCFRTLAAEGAAFAVLALALHPLPGLLLFLELFGFAAAYLLVSLSARNEALTEALRRTQDDSKERDLLLTEKNRTLLENQDYQIYTATLRERNRIAREIHDNVGHLLSRSILLTGALKTINKNEQLSDPLESLDSTLGEAMDSIRRSVHDLHDDAVDLDESLRSLIRDFTFCPVTYQYDAGREIPREVRYSFINITKEALSNIMRHSNATRAAVTVREHPALYQLSIEDNGETVGNSSGTGGRFPGGGTGIGLSNMQERVEKLHGNMHIFTEKGFRILITVPKERQT